MRYMVADVRGVSKPGVAPGWGYRLPVTRYALRGACPGQPYRAQRVNASPHLPPPLYLLPSCREREHRTCIPSEVPWTTARTNERHLVSYKRPTPKSFPTDPLLFIFSTTVFAPSLANQPSGLSCSSYCNFIQSNPIQPNPTHHTTCLPYPKVT